MSQNGRRAWRAAAKKLRRKLGLRWRSQDEWLYGKRWSELVPDLEAHRAHVTGAWFKRHGVTEQGPEKLDAQHLVRVYVGLWGTVDGDSVTYAMKPESFTARSLVGMTMGARKRAVRKAQAAVLVLLKGQPADPMKFTLLRRLLYRIGERLRPCPGCCACKSHMLRMRELKRAYPATAQQHPQHLRRIIERQSWRCGVRIMNADDSEHLHRTDVHCDGSGVLPARKSK